MSHDSGGAAGSAGACAAAPPPTLIVTLSGAGRDAAIHWPILPAAAALIPRRAPLLLAVCFSSLSVYCFAHVVFICEVNTYT